MAALAAPATAVARTIRGSLFIAFRGSLAGRKRMGQAPCQPWAQRSIFLKNSLNRPKRRFLRVYPSQPGCRIRPQELFAMHLRDSRIVLLALVAVTPLAASAGVIDFEGAVLPDYSGSGTAGSIPNGYAGMNWSTFSVMDTTIAAQAAMGGAVGYQNGFTSGSFLAYNDYGDPSSLLVPSGLPTIMGISGYFGASFEDGSTLTLTGYRGGIAVGTGDFNLVTTGPILYSISFPGGADTVVFSSTNGQFTLDDLTVVPEPTTIAALGLGAAALLRRRKRA
ncbi:PEP-CTERM sorting domain-containing protein [bacterium]|nr:MAG: PEP-CTERM sorting domain-containing protein [bacterium]